MSSKLFSKPFIEHFVPLEMLQKHIKKKMQVLFFSNKATI